MVHQKPARLRKAKIFAMAFAASLFFYQTGPLVAQGLPAPAVDAAAEPQPGMIASIVNTLATAWSYLTDSVTDAGTAVTPPTPSGFVKSLRGKDASEFWSLVGDAGYDLREVSTVVGLIPEVEVMFEIARELSEADREYVEERLDDFARREPGLVSKLQRSIVYALLEAAEIGEYRVEKLKINVLPLPRAEFSLSPADAPLTEEHDALLRAIRGHGKRERAAREAESPAANEKPVKAPAKAEATKTLSRSAR
ncbi:MAG: hypothetical protein HY057_14325 [Rhodospirillales bacterium]|nr:hypothetical protein [Rhodospirillales bacterium]